MRRGPVVRGRSVSAGAAVLVAAVVVLGAAPRAAAANCGERVIADWGDGHFDRPYSAACLGQALEELPEDLQVYSSAEEDITRLLNGVLAVERQRVLAQQARAARTATPAPKSRSVAHPVTTTTAKAAPARASRTLAGRAASAQPRRVAAPATTPAAEATGTFPLGPVIAGIAAAVFASAAAALALRGRFGRHPS